MVTVGVRATAALADINRTGVPTYVRTIQDGSATTE